MEDAACVLRRAQPLLRAWQDGEDTPTVEMFEKRLWDETEREVSALET